MMALEIWNPPHINFEKWLKKTTQNSISVFLVLFSKS